MSRTPPSWFGKIQGDRLPSSVWVDRPVVRKRGRHGSHQAAPGVGHRAFAETVARGRASGSLELDHPSVGKLYGRTWRGWCFSRFFDGLLVPLVRGGSSWTERSSCAGPIRSCSGCSWTARKSPGRSSTSARERNADSRGSKNWGKSSSTWDVRTSPGDHALESGPRLRSGTSSPPATRRATSTRRTQLHAGRGTGRRLAARSRRRLAGARAARPDRRGSRSGAR
jgi:hypothetical protein